MIRKRILAFTLLAGLAVAGKPITKESKQLAVLMSASKESVAPGDRVALTLDIELKPKMHVYAPGVQGYVAIDWQMADSNLAKPQAATWPKPQMLHLDAIGETVPVYTEKLRVTRNIVLASGSRNANFITVAGTLKYQACDDRMCYIPASVPLEWTFTVGRK